jgi:hypothetical protein
MPSLRPKSREALGHDDRYSLDAKSRALNPILRGWGPYVRLSHAHRPFTQIDSDVHTTLVNCLRRQHQRRGRGVREGPPAFVAEAGRYQLHGTMVRAFRRLPGERGRTAECGQSSRSV